MIVFHHDPVLKGAIRKNELSGKIDVVGNLGWQRTSSSVTDTDVYHIQWYLEKNYGLKNDRIINKALNIVASENRYHPICDCLEKLEWDGEQRIDKLLPRYLGADNDSYTKEIMRLLMLAAIHRVYEPGCKFEIMVCLVGGQGAGKSTFFRFLAINDEWFTDDLKRMDDDNVYRKMQELTGKQVAGAILGFWQERDLLAYFGDPKWDVRFRPEKESYTMKTTCKNNKYIITLKTKENFSPDQVEGTNIRMFDSQDLGAPNSVGPIPFSFLFPQRLKNPRLAPGQDWQVALSEDMMLVYDAWFEAGKTYEIVLLVD